MNKLFKMLPLFALLLGIGVALAGNLPSSAPPNTKEAFNGTTWIPITGQVEGVNYECDLAPTHNCTRELNSMGQVVSLIKGDYDSTPD